MPLIQLLFPGHSTIDEPFVVCIHQLEVKKRTVQ